MHVKPELIRRMKKLNSCRALEILESLDLSDFERDECFEALVYEWLDPKCKEDSDEIRFSWFAHLSEMPASAVKLQLDTVESLSISEKREFELYCFCFIGQLLPRDIYRDVRNIEIASKVLSGNR